MLVCPRLAKAQPFVQPPGRITAQHIQLHGDTPLTRPYQQIQHNPSADSLSLMFWCEDQVIEAKVIRVVFNAIPTRVFACDKNDLTFCRAESPEEVLMLLCFVPPNDNESGTSKAGQLRSPAAA
jgi:hypothetical protein